MRDAHSLVLSPPLACLAVAAGLLAVTLGGAPVGVTAQTAAADVPDLVGVWNGVNWTQPCSMLISTEG